MKVAIYARYSSDNQRDASIADQLRICREFAGRQSWTVVQEFTDHAVSGATLLRSGFQAFMRDALNRRFDVVLAESLDASAATRKIPPVCSSDSPSPASTSSRSLRATLRTCTSGSRAR
jgi:DNA invertase Pin-like site-specific DNA recombinase